MTRPTRALLIALALATVPIGALMMHQGRWAFAVAAWLSGIAISRMAREG